MDLISEACFFRPLYEHEAKWAAQIRISVADLDSYIQLFIAREYGAREEAQANLDWDFVDTSDLDALLAIKPWLPEHAEIWETAKTMGYFQDLRSYSWLSDPFMGGNPGLVDWVLETLMPPLGETRPGRSFSWRALVADGLKGQLGPSRIQFRDTFDRYLSRLPTIGDEPS